MMTKLETALMLVPDDLIHTLCNFGAEQAFIWLGQFPKDEAGFYYEMGRKTTILMSRAWEKELQRVPRTRLT